MFLVLRFNQLTVGSMDENLSNLPILDIGSGNSDLPFNTDKIEGDTQLEEEDD